MRRPAVLVGFPCFESLFRPACCVIIQTLSRRIPWGCERLGMYRPRQACIFQAQRKIEEHTDYAAGRFARSVSGLDGIKISGQSTPTTGSRRDSTLWAHCVSAVIRGRSLPFSMLRIVYGDVKVIPPYVSTQSWRDRGARLFSRGEDAQLPSLLAILSQNRSFQLAALCLSVPTLYMKSACSCMPRGVEL